MEPLTDRQRQALDFIGSYIVSRGYPPTLREIGEHMGIRSTNGVNDHLKALEKKGYLEREDLKSRALRPLHAVHSTASEASRGTSSAPGRAGPGASRGGLSSVPSLAEPRFPDHGDHRDRRGQLAPGRRPAHHADHGHHAPYDELGGHLGDLVEVPLLGRVAAGQPILAVEQAEETVRVDRFFLGAGAREVFALRVKGDSMVEAGIFDGDFIFVRKQVTAERGDIVVAMIDGEATVKYFHPEGDQVLFKPANRHMQPIVVRKRDFKAVDLIGVVVGVYRKLS